MRLTAIAALLTLAVSLPASALSLGEIHIDSRLGQPLAAEIPIRDDGNLTPEQLHVSLAEHALMAERGIDIGSIPADLRIVVRGKDHPGTIRLTTRRSIHEPGFGLLLRIDWPGGSVIRHYNLLFSLQN